MKWVIVIHFVKSGWEFDSGTYACKKAAIAAASRIRVELADACFDAVVSLREV